MREPWTRALWAGVATLCYLGGVLAFLAVVVGTGVVGPGPGLESMTTADYATLLASVGLFLAGGYAMRRMRQPVEPDRSTLPSQFQRGPGTSQPDLEATPEIAGESDGSDVVRCRNCGTENDTGFTFCGNCSSELPE